MKVVFSLAMSFILMACSANGNPSDYLRMKNIPSPTLQKFSHCYSYGCEKIEELSLPTDTIDRLIKTFKVNNTAKQERQNIAESIKIFEQDIGAIVGTDADKYGTFRIFEGENSQYNPLFQQDCVDESTNTTTYLMLLDQLNLLKFHAPGFPASRQPFTGGNRWWHQTATIIEINSEDRYAVDSWFEDNGYPAKIVPFSQWEAGWNPDR